MPIDPTNYATLSAMVAPAIFLTANGSLIISTSNRMSRVVDRIRVLNDQGDKLCRGVDGLDYSRERMDHVQDQLRHMLFRNDRIRIALTMLYLAFAAFVCTSLGLAIDVMLGVRAFAAVPTTLAVLGVCLMLVSCINLVREALEALKSNRLEIQFYRDLHQRRIAEGSGCKF